MSAVSNRIAVAAIAVALLVPLIATAAGTKGITWRQSQKNPSTGTITVHCANGCDAHNGDTPCTTPLPMLCIRKSGPGFPLPVPSVIVDNDQYAKWSGGVVATTPPIVPPSTLAAANNVCVKEFGPYWRVAEFHDGWGWGLQAYGGVGSSDKRFWIDINDQPNARCW
ncbi:MAG TPA: flagellar hook-length control protein [Thermoanaerobaculia bacterium]|jgi:hypothetical protein|nr:flagellar hook-length control protein [Thermoanaerobaculia bacterium]